VKGTAVRRPAGGGAPPSPHPGRLHLLCLRSPPAPPQPGRRRQHTLPHRTPACSPARTTPSRHVGLCCLVERRGCAPASVHIFSACVCACMHRAGRVERSGRWPSVPTLCARLVPPTISLHPPPALQLWFFKVPYLWKLLKETKTPRALHAARAEVVLRVGPRPSHATARTCATTQLPSFRPKCAAATDKYSHQ